jgi:hypothetical protein
MAIFDAMLELSDDQDIGTLTASEVEASENVFDFTQADLEMGAGEPLWLNVRMGTEAIVNSDSDATLTVALKTETNTDGTIDASSTTLWTTPAIAQTALTAGAWIMRMPLPYNVDDGRLIGLLYTAGGSSAFTAGKVDAWIDHGAQSSYDTQVTTSNI